MHAFGVCIYPLFAKSLSAALAWPMGNPEQLFLGLIGHHNYKAHKEKYSSAKKQHFSNVLVCHHQTIPHTHGHAALTDPTFPKADRLWLRSADNSASESQSWTSTSPRLNSVNSTSGGQPLPWHNTTLVLLRGRRVAAPPYSLDVPDLHLPFFHPHRLENTLSSLVNYSVYLFFIGNKGTFITSCPTPAQQSWFLFYEGLDPEPGKSLLLLFDSCCPYPTYSFRAILFIQQYPLGFVSVGKYYQCKLG